MLYCGFKEVKDDNGLSRAEFHVSRIRQEVENGDALSSSIPAYGTPYDFWKDCRKQEIKAYRMKEITIK